jgi:hypothetical protein
LLTEVVKELLAIIDSVIGTRERQLSTSSGLDLDMGLEVGLHQMRELLDKTQRQLKDNDEELKRRSNQIVELTSKVCGKNVAQLTFIIRCHVRYH